MPHEKLINYIMTRIRVTLDGGLLPTRKLPNQGFILVKLKSSLLEFYGLGWPL